MTLPKMSIAVSLLLTCGFAAAQGTPSGNSKITQVEQSAGAQPHAANSSSKLQPPMPSPPVQSGRPGFWHRWRWRAITLAAVAVGSLVSWKLLKGHYRPYHPPSAYLSPPSAPVSWASLPSKPRLFILR